MKFLMLRYRVHFTTPGKNKGIRDELSTFNIKAKISVYTSHWHRHLDRMNSRIPKQAFIYPLH